VIARSTALQVQLAKRTRLDYVFGRMQHHGQSDDGTRDDVSTTTSEHDSGSAYDDGDDGEVEDKDDNVFNTAEETQTRFNSTSAYVDPKLTTRLNGPQWQEPDPHTRRVPRVNYDLSKQFAQPAAGIRVPGATRVRASKVCMCYWLQECPGSFHASTHTDNNRGLQWKEQLGTCANHPHSLIL